ncbi:cell wall-binding repeat-containing protein [Oryzobacter sp. R7]|uniref:cell wall-binding repeat-containing protein n=1 Tax=Oryzobacter faecalis TaxID=3388656 RepID=UPI00398D4784
MPVSLPRPTSRRLGSLVVAAALALGLPVATVGPTSAAPAPRPVESAVTSASLRTTDPGPGARAAGPRAESDPVATGGLRVVGVSWPAGALTPADRVELRERTALGWGPWTAMDVEDEHTPDPGTPEAATARGGTDPWVSTAEAVQVRVAGASAAARPDRARLDVIDPGRSDADSGGPAVAGGASAGAVKPTILPRSQWGADESLRKGAPSYGTIRAAVVHHTAGTNSYSQAQVPGIIRGIYTFHVNGRGWNDVGYNFLIDRFGRIWEGRAGGIDQPVAGAHAGGFNSQTFGASALGDFGSVAPPAAVVTAQTRLIAWKLGLAHVDPTATTMIEGKGVLPTVIGHRDLNQTSCPGARYYALIPGMRQPARNLQGTMLFEPTLSSSSLLYGSGATTLRARATANVSWRMTVSSVCRTETQWSTSGSASTSSPVNATWGGRLSDGRWAPPGEYRVTLTASSGSGTAATVPPVVRVVRVEGAPGAPDGFCPPRLAGDDRYATAVAVAREESPAAQTVVVASGTDAGMADALVAAPLARARGGVLLLSSATGLSPATRAEVARRQATTAILVGGAGAVPEAVRDQLTALGVASVTRVGGADRYSTSVEVARAMGPRHPSVLVAGAAQASLVDGLVLAGPAAALGRPVVLVRPDRVPDVTRRLLADSGTTSTVVGGGTAAVSDEVLRRLPSPRRVAGPNRYETATAVGTWARSVMPVRDVVLASGEDGSLVDMLAAGQLGRVTMVSRRTALPAPVESWIASAPDLDGLVVVGGPAAVDLTVGGAAQRVIG